MRAGKLDREILIERVSKSIDAYGTPVETWTTFATLRAELTEESATDFIFKTRFIDGISVLDRVKYAGTAHDIKELKETGRRKGLEIHTLVLATP
jgi:head-tail adaptor